MNASISADPRRIAAAAPLRSEAAAANTGSGRIEISGVQTGYVLPATSMTLTYDGTTSSFSIAGLTGGSVAVTVAGVVTTYLNVPPALVPYTSDATISVDGVNFAISGQPKDGDIFTVGRNTGGVADARNALLLGRLQTQETMAGGTASFQSGYAQLVGFIGNKTHEAQVTGEAQTALLNQAIAAREAVAGVNLDEEAANLIRFQQAYQASARLIDISSRLFDTLVSLGR